MASQKKKSNSSQAPSPVPEGPVISPLDLNKNTRPAAGELISPPPTAALVSGNALQRSFPLVRSPVSSVPASPAGFAPVNYSSFDSGKEKTPAAGYAPTASYAGGPKGSGHANVPFLNSPVGFNPVSQDGLAPASSSANHMLTGTPPVNAAPDYAQKLALFTGRVSAPKPVEGEDDLSDPDPDINNLSKYFPAGAVKRVLPERGFYQRKSARGAAKPSGITKSVGPAKKNLLPDPRTAKHPTARAGVSCTVCGQTEDEAIKKQVKKQIKNIYRCRTHKHCSGRMLCFTCWNQCQRAMSSAVAKAKWEKKLAEADGEAEPELPARDDDETESEGVRNAAESLMNLASSDGVFRSDDW